MLILSPSVRGDDETPDLISIYSKRTGDFIKVEKMEETVMEQGCLTSRQYELTIVPSREDNELKQIQGTLNGKPIEGSLQGRGLDLELQMDIAERSRTVHIKNIIEHRGERLDIEFNRTGDGHDVREQLIAINKPNKIQVYSEDDSGKTSFYILFKKSEIIIFGYLKGTPVDYTITLPANRKWITGEELIIGSLHLALTGYFII
jgi:hypothetical protein